MYTEDWSLEPVVHQPSAEHVGEGEVFDALFKSVDKDQNGRADKQEVL